MDILEGFVDKIVFRNEENGYSVLSVICDDEEKTMVGILPYISEGEYIVAEGICSTHMMYGEQFQVKSYKIEAPEDMVSIERYLGSGAIKGVGPVMAARIVKKFKNDTFRIIEEEPERLAEIKGISPRKAQQISESVSEKREMRDAMMFLQQYGISSNLGLKIYTRYGPNMYNILKENPYRMAEDIAGVGFKIADDIASRMGIYANSEYRIRSAILYILLKAANDGNVCLPIEILLEQTKQLLLIDIEDFESHLTDMMIDKKIVIKETEEARVVYAAMYYYMELNTARMLKDLYVSFKVQEEAVYRRLEAIERHGGIELEAEQRKAVVAAMKNGLLVITGGPGTGKTTTINTIIRYFEEEDREVVLAAPTGRAAKRMTETTGYEARTIHRLLEMNGSPEENEHAQFLRDEDNPLDADVVIVDEMSMVDISLMHALLKAITVGTRLILVGDVNQLPSVGPGNVLSDIIRSESFPVVMLNKIFRQAAESDIIVNAHKINNGEQVSVENRSKDFLFLKREDPNMMISAMLTLIQKKLPDYVHADVLDIQVLTPTRKGALGVERLNTILQQYINPPDDKKREYEFTGGVFREGDKVMQIKNNYQLEWEIATKYGLVVDKGVGVFNGDIGRVTEINTYTEMVEVEFEEKKKVKYPFQMLDELELAYAVTIHKSQGSEYPAVVIPLLQGPRQLYHRNLIYTAVTRAKQCVTLVGSDTTFQEMICNTNEQNRYTSLAERIREL